jgi:hypothetical protein
MTAALFVVCLLFVALKRSANALKQTRNINKAFLSTRRFDAFLKKFKPMKSEELTIFLQGLRTCTKTQLSDDVAAITLGTGAKIPFKLKFGGETIYERSFYDDLLKKLRLIDRSVLTGTPGIHNFRFLVAEKIA